MTFSDGVSNYRMAYQIIVAFNASAPLERVGGTLQSPSSERLWHISNVPFSPIKYLMSVFRKKKKTPRNRPTLHFKSRPWNPGEVIKSGPGKTFLGFMSPQKLEYETKFNVYGLGDGLTMNSRRFNHGFNHAITDHETT